MLHDSNPTRNAAAGGYNVQVSNAGKVPLKYVRWLYKIDFTDYRHKRLET